VAARLWPAYLAAFLFVVAQWVSGVSVPLHVARLGGTVADAGLIVGIRFAMGALFQLPLGAVADAWGTRRTLLVAVGVNSATNLIPLAATAEGGLWPLYAWGLSTGIVASLFLPSLEAYIGTEAVAERRGNAFGWATLSIHSGVAAGPVLGGFLWERLGAVPTYVGAALVGCLAFVAPLFIARSQRVALDLRAIPGKIAAVARDRVVVGAWLAALAIGVPWGSAFGLFPLFGASLGMTAGAIGVVIGVQSLVNGASRLPLGWLIDRVPLAPLTMAAGAVGYGAVVALLGFQRDAVGSGIVLAAAVLALGFTLMMVQVVISERMPVSLRATALGGYGAALSAGLGIGPFVAGAVADQAGFATGFLVAAGVGVAAGVAAAALLTGAGRSLGAEAIEGEP
jgi:DHA1 family multidrug resistance protein-like MFS transporter